MAPTQNIPVAKDTRTGKTKSTMNAARPAFQPQGMAPQGMAPQGKAPQGKAPPRFEPSIPQGSQRTPVFDMRGPAQQQQQQMQMQPLLPPQYSWARHSGPVGNRTRPSVMERTQQAQLPGSIALAASTTSTAGTTALKLPSQQPFQYTQQATGFSNQPHGHPQPRYDSPQKPFHDNQKTTLATNKQPPDPATPQKPKQKSHAAPWPSSKSPESLRFTHPPNTILPRPQLPPTHVAEQTWVATGRRTEYRTPLAAYTGACVVEYSAYTTHAVATDDALYKLSAAPTIADNADCSCGPIDPLADLATALQASGAFAPAVAPPFHSHSHSHAHIHTPSRLNPNTHAHPTPQAHLTPSRRPSGPYASQLAHAASARSPARSSKHPSTDISAQTSAQTSEKPSREPSRAGFERGQGQGHGVGAGSFSAGQFGGFSAGNLGTMGFGAGGFDGTGFDGKVFGGFEAYSGAGFGNGCGNGNGWFENGSEHGRIGSGNGAFGQGNGAVELQLALAKAQAQVSADRTGWVTTGTMREGWERFKKAEGHRGGAWRGGRGGRGGQ